MNGTDFSLHYPFGRTVPDPGGYMEIRPGIFWLRIPLPGRLDHINLWLLDSGDSWTLVDTGLDWDEARGAWDRVADELVRDKPIGRIIVTHFHPGPRRPGRLSGREIRCGNRHDRHDRAEDPPPARQPHR